MHHLLEKRAVLDCNKLSVSVLLDFYHNRLLYLQRVFGDGRQQRRRREAQCAFSTVAVTAISPKTRANASISHERKEAAHRLCHLELWAIGAISEHFKMTFAG